MAVKLKKDTGEYVLDNDYEIKIAELSKTEEPHTHQFIELVYTYSGRGIHQIDGETYHVQSGDMLIINYHCRHTVTPIEKLCYMDIMLKPEYVNDTLKGTEDLFLLLQLRDFSDLSNQVIKDNVLLHFDDGEKQKIEFLLDWTRQEQKNNIPAGNTIIHSSLSILLSMVFRKMTENQTGRITLDGQLLHYIERNCSSKLPIQSIAAKCGYTTEHFSRIFKKYTGQTPMAYLLDCRIRKAKQLLSKTDLPIETVITQCGFTNRTAFFKKFSEQVGQTPFQYRKNQK